MRSFDSLALCLLKLLNLASLSAENTSTVNKKLRFQIDGSEAVFLSLFKLVGSVVNYCIGSTCGRPHTNVVLVCVLVSGHTHTRAPAKTCETPPSGLIRVLEF